MGNAAVNGSFSTSRPFGAMSQQPTPPEVKQAMEENPGCAFSTSSRSSFTSMNGDVSRKTVQSWLMTCPNQPTMKILEEEHTETGDSARASAGAGGGMQLPGPEDWPGLSGAGHSIFDDMGEIGKLLPSGAIPASGIMDPVASGASVPYVFHVCVCGAYRCNVPCHAGQRRVAVATPSAGNVARTSSSSTPVSPTRPTHWHPAASSTC